MQKTRGRGQDEASCDPSACLESLLLDSLIYAREFAQTLPGMCAS